MKDHIESDDNNVFAISLSELEIITTQTSIYIYFIDQLTKGNISLDEGEKYEKLAGKFQARGDLKIDLSADEIKKLYNITLEVYNFEYDRYDELIESNDYVKNDELNYRIQNYRLTKELNQKYLKIMEKNNIC